MTEKVEITGSGDRIELVNIVLCEMYAYECIRKTDRGQNKGISNDKDKYREKGEFVMQVRDRKTSRIVNSK